MHGLKRAKCANATTSLDDSTSNASGLLGGSRLEGLTFPNRATGTDAL